MRKICHCREFSLLRVIGLCTGWIWCWDGLSDFFKMCTTCRNKVINSSKSEDNR